MGDTEIKRSDKKEICWAQQVICTHIRVKKKCIKDLKTEIDLGAI